MSDITITIDKKYDLVWKHIFEKELDKIMVPLGFTRSGSSVLSDDTTVARNRGISPQAIRNMEEVVNNGLADHVTSYVQALKTIKQSVS